MKDWIYSEKKNRIPDIKKKGSLSTRCLSLRTGIIMSHSLGPIFSNEADSSDGKDELEKGGMRSFFEVRKKEVKILNEALLLAYAPSKKFPKEVRDSVDLDVYLTALDIARTTIPRLSSKAIADAFEKAESPNTAMFWPFFLDLAVYETEGNFFEGYTEPYHYGGEWMNDTVCLDEMDTVLHVPPVHLLDCLDKDGVDSHLHEYSFNLISRQIEQHEKFLDVACDLISCHILHEPRPIHSGLLSSAMIFAAKNDPHCLSQPMGKWLPFVLHDVARQYFDFQKQRLQPQPQQESPSFLSYYRTDGSLDGHRPFCMNM